MAKLKKEFMYLKLNIGLLGNKAGAVIKIESANKVPKEKFWRDRIKDSAIDECVEVVSKPKQSKSTSVEKTSEVSK